MLENTNIVSWTFKHQDIHVSGITFILKHPVLRWILFLCRFLLPVWFWYEGWRWRLERAVHPSKRTCWDYLRAGCLSFDLSADLFMTQSDPVTIQIQRWCICNRCEWTCHSVTKSYQGLIPAPSETLCRFFFFYSAGSYRPAITISHLEWKPHFEKAWTKSKFATSSNLTHSK